MIHRLRKITDGLYRGSAPSPKDVLWLKENLGINKIISLDEQAGKNISRACKMLNINQIILPIDHNNLIESVTNVLKHNIKDLLLDGGPTFIHCQEGKDRTGFLTALFKCKYMGMEPEKALEEAKSLGFGIGADPKMIKLFTKMIKACKKSSDNNNADIVSNEREYKSDNHDTYLDEGHQGSFAPYLSKTREYPYDSVYLDINNQSMSRENYDEYKNVEKTDKEGEVDIPLVGNYNNNGGIIGVGPAINPGGFMYD